MIHPDRSIEGTAVDADAQIFAALYPSLRRYAAVIGSLSDDPDDLVQKAVARTLRQDKLAELDSPAAYLRRSISNLVINGARSDMSDRSRNHLVVTDDEWRDVYPSDLGLLEQLSTTERAVLLLADIEGRKPCSCTEPIEESSEAPIEFSGLHEQPNRFHSPKRMSRRSDPGLSPSPRRAWWPL